MFTRVLPAVIAALALMTGAAPALAQVAPGISPPGAEAAVTGEAVSPSRLRARPAEAPQTARPRARPGRPAAAPTPEQNKAAADALIAATSSTCQTTEVTLRGQVAEGQTVYEVACATGPGLVLISSTPPQAVDCVALSGQADIARAADPAADVGLQCQIEGNKDILKVMKQYATEAGLAACTVDQGAAVGKSSAGQMVYEIGCTNADGYRIEKAATGWTKTPCFEIMSGAGRCRYTTPAEQAATLKAWLASNPTAAACDVAQARYMGANANGSFYEAKCAAGDGIIARFDTAMAVQQVYPCAEAARIGGGCKLTETPAAATPAPAAAPATPPATR